MQSPTARHASGKGQVLPLVVVKEVGTAPIVLSGSDIGFRVERQGRDKVAGTLVVRINGQWVPAEPVARVKY